MYLNASGLIVGLGNFGVTQKAGLAIDDGHVQLTNASELLVRLTNVSLFVGTGSAVTRVSGVVTGLDLTNATGFSATGANLDLAVIGEDPKVGTRRWTGLAASIGSMGAVGLPNGVVVKVNNLNLFDNIPDGSASPTKMDWKALADKSGDALGLDGTRLANLPGTVDLVVSGAMLITIDNYVYLSGTLTLHTFAMPADEVRRAAGLDEELFRPPRHRQRRPDRC